MFLSSYLSLYVYYNFNSLLFVLLTDLYTKFIGKPIGNF